MSQNIQSGVNALVSMRKYKTQMGKGEIIDNAIYYLLPYNFDSGI